MHAITRMLSACLVAIWAAIAAAQTTWLVSNNPAENPDFAHPRAALASPLVVDGDTIEVSAGLGPYWVYPGQEIRFHGKAITLRAIAGQRVRLYATGELNSYAAAVRIDQGEGRDSVLDGFELSCSLWTYAAVYVDNASPLIRNCDFVGAYGSHGSVIIITESGDARFENCTLRECGGHWTAYSMIDCRGNMTMVDCTLTDNAGELPLFIITGNAVFENCLIADSFLEPTSHPPGPFFVHSLGTLRLDRCRIENVRFKASGPSTPGIELWGSATITNSVFVRNGFSSVFDVFGVCNLVNCTFAPHTSVPIVSADSPGSVIVSNTIVWGNELGPSAFPAGTSVRFSNVQGGWPGPGNINVDPGFVRDGTFALAFGSPCIDAGENGAIPPGITTDFFGNPRRYDDVTVPDTGLGTAPLVDIGAAERFVCRPDVVPDGVLNNNDFFFYLTLFAAHHPSADFTSTAIPGSAGFAIPDGAVNNDDFFCFLYLFSAGCEP